MPFKPSYNHQRAERDRAKKASKEAKIQGKKDAALRKSNEAAAELNGEQVQDVAEQPGEEATTPN